METRTLKQKRDYAKQRGYTLLEDENFNRRAKVTLVEDMTGVEYTVHWNNFRMGATPKVTTLRQKQKQAKEQGYTLLETENFSTQKLVKLKNNKTGETYEVRYNDFLYKGYREKSVTTISKGEAVIKAYLETNLKKEFTFNYQEKVYISDSKRYFDFCIKNQEGDSVAFIEYNGIQHYKVVDRFGEESYKHTQDSDSQKKAYAQKLGVPLVIIPYTIKKKEAIAQTIKEALPEYTLPRIQPFVPRRTKRSHTSLEEKKELAKDRGWYIDPSVVENFTHMDKVKLINVHTEEAWCPKWQDFLDGASPRKDEAKKRMTSTLEDKRKIADYLGYELLERENFTVKKRVKLKVKETQEIITLQWEPVQARYKRKVRALEQSGFGLE